MDWGNILIGFLASLLPNAFFIKWALYTLTARIREIVAENGKKIEDDFNKQLIEIRKDFNEKFIEQRDKISHNSEEIVRLKTQREGSNDWMKELSERMDTGFRDLGKKIDDHIERSHK